MKVRLTKPNRIEKGRAGDIVEVSTARALYLLRYGLAEPAAVRERIETPEKAVRTRKTERAAVKAEAETTDAGKAKPRRNKK